MKEFKVTYLDTLSNRISHGHGSIIEAPSFEKALEIAYARAYKRVGYIVQSIERVDFRIEENFVC